jgi:oligoendopeptidase F
MAETKTQWDLPKYFYASLDDPKFVADREAILPKVRAFADAWRDRLAKIQKPEELAEFFEADEKLSKELSKPSHYLYLLGDLDTQDQKVIRLTGEMQVIFVEVGNLLLFISQAWKEIGAAKLFEWADSPALAPYRNAVIQTAESVKRILSEGEEYVLNTQARALSLATDLYEELTGSYEFEIEIDGKKQVMTDAEIRALRESPDRETRRKAFESIRKVYGTKQNQIALGNCYSSVLKSWSSRITLRKYGPIMEPRNVSEELDNEVVDLLLSEVRAAYPLFSRYLKAKKKILGLDTFHNYDVFAPISTKETPCSFEEGLAMHMETMEAFDPEFAAYSKAIFEEGRVDVFPKKGKRGGACAIYDKDLPSFVLLNYTGKLLDVTVISHELGHAIHGNISQVQKDAVYSSPLSLAETASIFSEMLLSEKLREHLTDEERIDFLSNEISDTFSSIFRQVQYVSFEKRAHEAIHSGKELTYADFNVLWREEQVAMSGDAIDFDIPAEEEVGWSTIPHIFHTPFYCYAYSFGNLLVFALYQRYLEVGKPFIKDYKEILAAGGSMRPKDLLAKYGFDITKPEFYRLGLSILEKKVEEFERLAYNPR